jgi:hypothetical protein
MVFGIPIPSGRLQTRLFNFCGQSTVARYSGGMTSHHGRAISWPVWIIGRRYEFPALTIRQPSCGVHRRLILTHDTLSLIHALRYLCQTIFCDNCRLFHHTTRPGSNPAIGADLCNMQPSQRNTCSLFRPSVVHAIEVVFLSFGQRNLGPFAVNDQPRQAAFDRPVARFRLRRRRVNARSISAHSSAESSPSENWSRSHRSSSCVTSPPILCVRQRT